MPPRVARRREQLCAMRSSFRMDDTFAPGAACILIWNPIEGERLNGRPFFQGRPRLATGSGLGLKAPIRL